MEIYSYLYLILVKIQKKCFLIQKITYKKFSKIIIKLQNRLNKTCLDQFNEFNKVSDLLMDLDKDSSIPMIIIRPHPSEDHEPWERISKKLKKIKVFLRVKFLHGYMDLKQFYIEDVQPNSGLSRKYTSRLHCD